MEERIQQVLGIEKEARRIHDDAIQQAERILHQAEQEAASIIEKAKAEAQQEARRLVSNTGAKNESARIQAEAEGKSADAEKSATENFERAVRFVLEKTAGKD